MSAAPHIPVLLDEVIEALQPAPGSVIVDATFGAGGYTRRLLPDLLIVPEFAKTSFTFVNSNC